MGLADTGGFADAAFGLEAAFETGFCAVCATGAVLTLPESAVLAAGFLDAALAFAGAAVFAAGVAEAFATLGAVTGFAAALDVAFSGAVAAWAPVGAFAGFTVLPADFVAGFAASAALVLLAGFA